MNEENEAILDEVWEDGYQQGYAQAEEDETGYQDSLEERIEELKSENERLIDELREHKEK